MKETVFFVIKTKNLMLTNSHFTSWQVVYEKIWPKTNFKLRTF